MNFNQIALIAISLTLSLNTIGQKILINGEESNGKLNWSDFTGKIDKRSSFNAYTAYKFNTKIERVKFVGDSATIIGFQAILELDQKNSWAKKDKITDDLLIHEQGHFNLGILCIRELIAKVNEAKFTKSNYNNLLQTFINDVSKKYNDLGIKYDEETNHSEDVQQQKKWNTFFVEHLK